MARLTDKTIATAVTLNSLVHIVNTGDTTQNSTGSSYKAELGQVADAIGGYQYYTEIVVSSAEILTLSSSPIELLPNPGIGNYYDAKFIIEYTFNTTPYVAVRPLAITDGTNISYECFNLSSYGSDTIFIYLSMLSIIGNGLFSNSPLYITNQVSNPTSGDGTMLLKIWYSIRQLG